MIQKSLTLKAMLNMLLMLLCSTLLCSATSLADDSKTTNVEAKTDVLLPDPLQAGWEDQAVCESLYEDEINRTLRCTFPPGVGHERHYHRPHFGYALSGGRMRLVSDSGMREVDLPTGTSYYSQGVEWHEVLNVGDTTVQYLIVEQK